MIASILWPMLAHIGWVSMLYVWLTVARQRAVRSGQIESSCFVLGRDEPLDVARITRNLANQFELPLIFYALVVLLVALGQVTLFDVIAAYDVLEHLSIPEINITLDAIAKMLKPGGELMLRFPNGQSPFGRFLQHADHTHRSTLSLAILDQLTVCGPLTISRYKSKKPAPIGPLRHRLGVHLKSSMRVVTEWYLKKIFDLNCELGTNVVVRLTKRT